MAASATLALKAGVWFRRGRLLMVSPDSRGTACPPSGRNSTYRPVQISGTGSKMGCLTQISILDQTNSRWDTIARSVRCFLMCQAQLACSSVFRDEFVRYFQGIARPAKCRLEAINAAHRLDDL